MPSGLRAPAKQDAAAESGTSRRQGHGGGRDARRETAQGSLREITPAARSKMAPKPSAANAVARGGRGVKKEGEGGAAASQSSYSPSYSRSFSLSASRSRSRSPAAAQGTIYPQVRHPAKIKSFKGGVVVIRSPSRRRCSLKEAPNAPPPRSRRSRSPRRPAALSPAGGRDDPGHFYDRPEHHTAGNGYRQHHRQQQYPPFRQHDYQNNYHRHGDRAYGSTYYNAWGGAGKGGPDGKGKGGGKVGKSNHAPSTGRIHVSGLPTGATPETLQELFSKYGKVLGLQILGARRGHLAASAASAKISAIVRFDAIAEADAAIEALHGNSEVLPGAEKLVVKMAKPNARWD